MSILLVMFLRAAAATTIFPINPIVQKRYESKMMLATTRVTKSKCKSKCATTRPISYPSSIPSPIPSEVTPVISPSIFQTYQPLAMDPISNQPSSFSNIPSVYFTFVQTYLPSIRSPISDQPSSNSNIPSIYITQPTHKKETPSLTPSIPSNYSVSPSVKSSHHRLAPSNFPSHDNQQSPSLLPHSVPSTYRSHTIKPSIQVSSGMPSDDEATVYIPSFSPSKGQASIFPTRDASKVPSLYSLQPDSTPTGYPSNAFTFYLPSLIPSYTPSKIFISNNPTLMKRHGFPSTFPSQSPSDVTILSVEPTSTPTISPNQVFWPTKLPSTTVSPSVTGADNVSMNPSWEMSSRPSNHPTDSITPVPSTGNPTRYFELQPSTTASKILSIYPTIVPSVQNSERYIIITATLYEIKFESSFELSKSELLEIVQVADSELSYVFSASLELSTSATFQSTIISANFLSDRSLGKDSRRLERQTFLQLETKTEIRDTDNNSNSNHKYSSLILSPSFVNASIQSFYRSPIYMEALIERLKESSNERISQVEEISFSRFLRDSQAGSFIQETNAPEINDDTDLSSISYFLLGGLISLIGLVSSFVIHRKRQQLRKRKRMTLRDQRHIL